MRLDFLAGAFCGDSFPTVWTPAGRFGVALVEPAFKPGDDALEVAGLGSLGFMRPALSIVSRSVRCRVCPPKSWPAFASPMFDRRLIYQ